MLPGRALPTKQHDADRRAPVPHSTHCALQGAHIHLIFAALSATGHASHYQPAVIDLALVEMQEGQLTGARWHQRFTPWCWPMLADEQCPRLSDGAMDSLPRFHHALPELLLFARLDQVVVHNMPCFHPALVAEFDRAKAYAPNFYWAKKIIDTRPLLRTVHPDIAENSHALYAHYGLATGDENTTALQHAHTLAQLWQAADLAKHAPDWPLHLESEGPAPSPSRRR